MFAFIRNFLNGLAFGITETIPGVSGGTIAIILGFYAELIETVNHFFENKLKYMKFLVPLMLGATSGILFFSSVIHYLLENHSFPTWMFLIGLIVGITPLVFLKIKASDGKIEIREVLLMLIPIAILIIISCIKEPASNPEELFNSINFNHMFFLFTAGIIAAAALVLPGVSGSFVLVLLGLYPLIIYSLKQISIWITQTSDFALVMDICKILVPFAIGAIIGGLTMARLVEKLLKNYTKIIYSIILGLLSGSIVVLFKAPEVYKSGVSPTIIIFGVATLALGCLLSFNIGRRHL